MKFYIKAPLLFMLVCLLSTNAYCQNRTEYFKAKPAVDSLTPDWAKLMYSDNPYVPAVEDLYTKYYKTNKFVKTLHTQNHKYWLNIVKPILTEDGYIGEPKQYTSLPSGASQLRIAAGEADEWVAMGPFETFIPNTTTPISYHKNVYSISQSLTNSNLLICGTESGGVYKTTDKGANWTLISKSASFCGNISAVKIHPTNNDIFLVSSNSRIYQSLDGGVTWIERMVTDGSGNEFKYSPANANIIFHTSFAGLFKSTNGGTTWTKIFSQSCWDIDFHPTDFTTVYLLKSNTTLKKSELYKSTDGGTNWILKTQGWYAPTDLANAAEFGGKIAVSAASPNTVYVALVADSKSGDNGWAGIYKSTDKGENWANVTGQVGSPYAAINSNGIWNIAAYDGGYHQGFYNFDFEVSQTNSNQLWVGTLRFSESLDGGKTFKSLGGPDAIRFENMHADIQDLEIVGNDFWVASDGGINYLTTSLTSHVAKNRGIIEAEFWGFNTGWNEDVFTGGKYHCGTSGWSEKFGAGKDYHIGGVEEATGYIHPIESRKIYYRGFYGSEFTNVNTLPSVFGGNLISNETINFYSNEAYDQAERSGFYFDPRYAEHIYVGRDNKIYKSIDAGKTFSLLYAFPEASGMVYEIEISRSNPKVMYAVYNKTGGYWEPSEIYKTADGGKTWTQTQIIAGTYNRYRLSIHPQDENKVWISNARAGNNNKVYATTNGGTTWTNKTTSVLDNQNTIDILYQGGSNDVVYVITESGVFYWDSKTSNWVNYSVGLPLIVNSLQINPFYRDAELRLASRGRGVWSRKMQDTLSLPIAQPITYSDTVVCSKDTILFDCYSILKHQGASWSWNIAPQPKYISSTTVRNPKVVFGKTGKYTVSLTVTNAQGKSDTKTIANMVGVSPACDPPVVSFTNIKNGDAIIQNTDLNINVNATHPSGINNVKLYLNNILVRQESTAPYDWGLGTNDPQLNTLAVGNYTLRALAQATNGDTSSVKINFSITTITGVYTYDDSKILSVFPNPVSENLYLNQYLKWALFDLSGKVVLSGDGNVVECADLTTGVYILKARNKYMKIVKE